jgi:hypothetical protein
MRMHVSLTILLLSVVRDSRGAIVDTHSWPRQPQLLKSEAGHSQCFSTANRLRVHRAAGSGSIARSAKVSWLAGGFGF